MKWISNTYLDAKNAIIARVGETNLEAQTRHMQWRNKFREGDPKATSSYSVAELKQMGIIGLYKYEVKPGLNDLLADAKAAKATWDEWERHPEGYDRPGWRVPYRANDNAWAALITAIHEADKPLVFIDGAGHSRTIGTVGLCSSDLMLHYSEKIEAEYVMSGYRLDMIQSFEDK
jgi:hypothetical protein